MALTNTGHVLATQIIIKIHQQTYWTERCVLRSSARIKDKRSRGNLEVRSVTIHANAVQDAEHEPEQDKGQDKGPARVTGNRN